MFTVAIVSPSRSLEPINKVITGYDFGCKFNKYIYKELSDIDKIYIVCNDSRIQRTYIEYLNKMLD